MQTITLDIGGTTIKSALIDNFIVLSKTKVSTNANLGFKKIMESIFASIDFHLPFLSYGKYKIGISSAGDIDPINGIVTYATDSLPNFSGLKLKEIIEQKYNVPTYLLNDALCATIAEFELNDELKDKNFVMLTLGTGVGGGIILNSKILLGDHFKACRLGHIKIYNNGRACPCGEKGCMEAYVSAKGFLNTSKDFGLDYKDSNLVFANNDSNLIDKITDKYTDDLIYAIDILANIFDPYAIVLGGGFVMTADFWFKKLLSKNAKPVKIIKAKLQNDAGMFGAYCIANNINKYYN